VQALELEGATLARRGSKHAPPPSMPRFAPTDTVETLLYGGKALVDERLELGVCEDVRPVVFDALPGGALTTLGDPPLFIEFLHGVDFFWIAQNLWLQTSIVALLVFVIFLAVDTWQFRREPAAQSASARIGVHGKVNFVLIAIIVASMLASAAWKPGISFNVYGSRFELQNLVRDAVFIAVALASLWLTPEEHRAAPKMALLTAPPMISF
jgi:Na+/H+ antiporter NhaD/arsenite permease-like protein